MKKEIGVLLAGMGVGYLCKEYIGKYIDITKITDKEYMAKFVEKGLKSFMGNMADKAVPQTSQSDMFNYYMDQMRTLNHQLGANIATALLPILGVSVIACIGGYLLSRYLR